MRAELWEALDGSLYTFALDGESAVWARYYGKGRMAANQDDEADAADDLREIAQGADPVADEWPNWEMNEDWDGTTPVELHSAVSKYSKLLTTIWVSDNIVLAAHDLSC